MSLDVNVSEPDEFNCNELHSCIKEIVKIKDIEDFSYHVDYVCGRGENFIANIFRVTVKESEHGDKSFSVIVKTLINTTKQELFHELHKREVFAYEEVIKKFKKLQESIDDEERVNLPECLYSKIEYRNEIIILEDLKVKMFAIDNKLDRFEPLDYAQVSVVLKNLAKFHALTFVYDKYCHETFEKVKIKFRDIIFSNSFLNKSKLKNYFHDSFETSIKVVEDLEVRKQLESILPKLLDLLQNFTSPGERNVLCHGDCWINNVMFRNEDTDVTKVCFIDFQAMRYANPTTDILHFIYLCTDSAFRSAYFEDLLNDYYDSLKSFLELFDIDVNFVYTNDDFNSDIEKMKPYGFLIALIEMKIITSHEDEGVDRESTLVLNSGGDEYYKLRVNDVVTESINNGVLSMLVDKR